MRLSILDIRHSRYFCPIDLHLLENVKSPVNVSNKLIPGIRLQIACRLEITGVPAIRYPIWRRK
jgi:hypothetical protein